jgi:hypothetical protein
LRIGKARTATFIKAQAARTKRNRARGNNDAPLPRLMPRINVRNERLKPFPSHSPVWLHQQR